MKMKQTSSIRLIIIGFILLVIGMVLPFLMVIRLLEPSFLLSLLCIVESYSTRQEEKRQKSFFPGMNNGASIPIQEVIDKSRSRISKDKVPE